MKIYFSGSISGGRHYENIYLAIATYLQAQGHNILSLHVARSDMLPEFSKASPEEIYTRDIRWVEESDLVIAEVSTPSLGVGFEICHALHVGKPVLCLFDEKVKISQMILGNNHPNIKVVSYSDEIALGKALDKYVSNDFPAHNQLTYKPTTLSLGATR